MNEFEGQAVRFTIDHYEPRSARPELKNEYSNLMWSCDTCNVLKGDRCPPEQARADGYRFFRPDQDSREEHFQVEGARIQGKTNTGKFTNDACELNRGALRRLRDLRRRLTECHEFVAGGVAALRKFPIDRLPPHLKARAALYVHQANALAQKFGNEIDGILLAYAGSDVLDDDDELGHSAASLKELKRLEGLYPTAWRTRQRSVKKVGVS